MPHIARAYICTGKPDRVAPLARLHLMLAIELVVEECADLDRRCGPDFEAIGAERLYQADNAEAGAEALFRI